MVESGLDQIPIFATTAGNYTVITFEHVHTGSSNATVGSIGHFDGTIEMAKLDFCARIVEVMCASLSALGDHHLYRFFMADCSVIRFYGS